MKIALINPPTLWSTPNPPLSQCLGLASIGATIREDGHKVLIIDSAALGYKNAIPIKIAGRNFFRIGLDNDDLARLVPKDTELIGITAPFTYYSYIIKPLIKALRKRHRSLRIILGGVYPSTLPFSATKMGTDYIAIGEGEEIFSSFIKGEAIEKIDGLYSTRYLLSLGSDNNFNYTMGMVKDLNKLPTPARDLLPFDLYIKSDKSARGKGELGASIHTSRGCPYACAFCSIHSVFKRGYRTRSADNIWQEMQEIIDKYNIYHFEFEDDNLTLDKERAITLFSKMAEWNQSQKKKISFITPNGIRIDTLDKEMIALIKQAGCSRLSLALEHGDPEMLELMNKKLNLEKVKEVVYYCKMNKIKMIIFLIIGYPGETVKRWKKGIKFVKGLKQIDKNLVFLINAAQALPKTPLLKLCQDKGYLVGIDPNEMLLPGNFSNINTPDFTPEEIRKRIAKTDIILAHNNFITRGLAGIKRLLLNKLEFIK